MPRVLFGADGIRYVAGAPPLDECGVSRIGRAIARYLAARTTAPRAIIGRDTRSSGRWISELLQARMLAEGVNVVDTGIMTTPSIAYLSREQDADMGIAISASHNPAEYNGIKLVGRSGLRLQREDELEIENLIDDLLPDSQTHVKAAGERCDGEHLRELYIQDHVQHAPATSLRGFSVVLDCANGAASYVGPEVFRRLEARVTAINSAPDGENINRCSGSEHARRKPQDLGDVVRGSGASYGFAFDGDGDRLVAIDAEGCVYDGDDLLYALGMYYQGQGELQRDTVVATQMSNRGLDVALAHHRIGVVRAGKGDKAVEAAMWSGGFLLGGEQVGNIIINDGHHTAADGIYTALVVASVLYTGRLSLKKVVTPLQKWPQVRTSLHCENMVLGDALLALEEIAQRHKAIVGADWRILAWRSTTEDGVLRLMVEGGAVCSLTEVEQVARSVRETFVSTTGVSSRPESYECVSQRRPQ